MKILMFANTDWYLYKRLSLMRALRSRGHEVVLMSPPKGYSHGDYANRLEEAGFRWISFPMSRRGINIFSELLTLLRLVQVYRRERPDVVHHFTVKCVLYGSLASRIVGIKSRVNGIPGLGHIFSDNGMKSKLLRSLIKLFYRLALKHTLVIFQNPDDQRYFLEHGLVSGRNSFLIRGSGVDTKRFRPLDKTGESKKIVLLASRMLWSKGLAEYIEAANIVRSSFKNVTFKVAGETDAGNPSAISQSVIDEWGKRGDVEILGYCDDMENLLGQAHIVVLPTYYGEGVPRILIEGAAFGLPLVATDIPGCREIVRQDVNGFLVPVKDSQKLADSILTLLEYDDLRMRMGKTSRQIACEEFGQELVINNTLAVYRNNCRT